MVQHHHGGPYQRHGYVSMRESQTLDTLEDPHSRLLDK